MAFSPVLPVGGSIDYVKRIGHIDGLTFPENVFPSLFGKYMKGLRSSLPAATGIYPITFTLPIEMEFAEVGFAATGYSDGDYWELLIGDELVFETIYTKEIPQSIMAGSGIGNVTKLPAGTVITINFHNESAASKTVYYDLKFFK